MLDSSKVEESPCYSSRYDHVAERRTTNRLFLLCYGVITVLAIALIIIAYLL